MPKTFDRGAKKSRQLTLIGKVQPLSTLLNDIAQFNEERRHSRKDALVRKSLQKMSKQINTSFESIESSGRQLTDWDSNFTGDVTPPMLSLAPHTKLELMQSTDSLNSKNELLLLDKRRV